jgi:peptidylprolyl isomerase
MSRPCRLLLLSLLALALPLSACGGDDAADEQPAAPPAATAEATPDPAEIDRIADAVTEDLGEKPQVPAPQGAPPAELVKRDIVKGEGTRAKAGDTVSVQYVGVSWSSGEEFDASWDRGQAFAFTLGAGQVIPGWDEGVAGMREGGRRLLVIPPDLAYGPAGSPPAIGPDETLIFVVDLQGARSS